MSRFHELAVLPSCILAVDAQNGGSWFSRLRPPTPHVFSTSTHWSGFVSAFNSNGIKNYHFSIKFSLSEMPSRDRVLFGNQMALGEGRFMIVLSSKGKIQVQDESSWSGRVEHPISGTGKHTIMIEIAESSGTVTIDGVEYAVSVSRTAPILTIAFSNFPGTISSILLESDSSTLWQAAYSDLYETSNPWPLPVPRNFAEEPEAWRDEKTTAPAIEEDDCEFFIRYRLDGYPEGSAISQIFYHNSQNGSVNIAFAGDGTGGNYSVIRLTNAGAFVIPLDRVRQLGEHTIRIQRVGLTVAIEFDGEVAATSSAGTKKIAVYSTTAPVSDFDGVIFETYWKSLTTGRIVWRYPSEAERVRLITKTNVRTDRGYLEQADTAVNSYVNTALDLRGRVSSYTVFVDFYPAVFPESNNAECHQELAGQGGALIGTNFPPICSVGYYKAVDKTYHLQFAQQSGSLRRTINVTLAAALSGRCKIVGVVDVQSSSTVLTLYLDGEQIGTSTYSGIPDGTAASIASRFSVAGVKEYGGWINYTGKVYSCLLFDRALSAAEIAALS